MADDNDKNLKQINETLLKIQEKFNKPIWITTKKPDKDVEAEKEKKGAQKKTDGLLKSISDNILKMSKSLNKSFLDSTKKVREQTKKGIGLTIATFVAPLLLLVNFFAAMGPQIKWMKKIGKFGLTKLLAPLKWFLGKTGITKIFTKIGNSIKSLNTAIKESRVVQIIDDVGKTVRESKVFNWFRELGPRISGWFKANGTIGKIGTFFRSIGTWLKEATVMTKVGAGILKWASVLGRTLGKIFWPITLLIAVFDLVTGFMEGYKKDGIFGGIEKGLSKMFSGLIGIPLDLMVSLVSWIAGKFGFKETEKGLDKFVKDGGFEKIVTDIVEWPFKMIRAVGKWWDDMVNKDWGKAFDDTMASLMSGYKDFKKWINETLIDPVLGWFSKKFKDIKGYFTTAWDVYFKGFKDIGKWVTDTVFKPAIEWVVLKFNWAKAAWQNFSLMDTVEKAFDKVVKWFGDIFDWVAAKMPNWDIVGGIKSFIRDFIKSADDKMLGLLIPNAIRNWVDAPKPPETETSAPPTRPVMTYGAETAMKKSDIVGMEAEMTHLENAMDGLHQKGKSGGIEYKKLEQRYVAIRNKRNQAQAKTQPIVKPIGTDMSGAITMAKGTRASSFGGLTDDAKIKANVLANMFGGLRITSGFRDQKIGDDAMLNSASGLRKYKAKWRKLLTTEELDAGAGTEARKRGIEKMRAGGFFSQHEHGNALDFSYPEGFSDKNFSQLQAKVAAAFPGATLIKEKDHLHMQFDKRTSGIQLAQAATQKGLLQGGAGGQGTQTNINMHGGNKTEQHVSAKGPGSRNPLASHVDEKA